MYAVNNKIQKEVCKESQAFNSNIPHSNISLARFSLSIPDRLRAA